MRYELRAALAAGWLGVAVGAFSPALAKPAKEPAAPPAATAEDPMKPAAEIVGHFADWVTASRDNDGLPFVVVDKVDAAVFVFSPDGTLTGAAPALLGFAQGDDSAPGVGDRELSAIPPAERTTPAGRFMAGYGPAHGGKEVLWVDYETAISMHPLHDVQIVDPHERRLQRLKSPTPLDNRITYGCINLPDAFYEEVIRPTFTGTTGIVYILPDTRQISEVFPINDRKTKLKSFWRRLTASR